MINWLRDAWNAEWIVINKKVLWPLGIGLFLYYFYDYAFTKGIYAMAQYMQSQAQAETPVVMDNKV